MVEPADGSARALDGELRADALDVLRDVLQWRLTRRRWNAVESALEAMRAALTTGELVAFRAAVDELELSGPTRTVPFGQDPHVALDPRVEDEVYRLIYTLDGRQPGTPGADEPVSGRDDRKPPRR